MQSADICTSASGLASKMTPITPIGQVSRYRVSPSSSSLASFVWNSGSGICTRSWMPFMTSRSLPSSNLRRFKTGTAIPSASACSISCLFASKIASLLSVNAFATAKSAWSRSSPVVPASFGPASFTSPACSSIVICSSLLCILPISSITHCFSNYLFVFYNYRMKFVWFERSATGGTIPFSLPASKHFNTHAILCPRLRIVCMPSRSFAASSAHLPCT